MTYTRYELTEDALIWCDESGTVRFRKSSRGSWYIDERLYSFDSWLETVDLPDEEKVMLKLSFG